MRGVPSRCPPPSSAALGLPFATLPTNEVGGGNKHHHGPRNNMKIKINPKQLHISSGQSSPGRKGSPQGEGGARWGSPWGSGSGGVIWGRAARRAAEPSRHRAGEGEASVPSCRHRLPPPHPGAAGGYGEELGRSHRLREAYRCVNLSARAAASFGSVIYFLLQVLFNFDPIAAALRPRLPLPPSEQPPRCRPLP